MRTVTNMFIANLAFADIIIGLFAIPFQFQAALLQRWNLPDVMCAFCPFVQVNFIFFVKTLPTQTFNPFINFNLLPRGKDCESHIALLNAKCELFLVIVFPVILCLTIHLPTPNQTVYISSGKRPKGSNCHCGYSTIHPNLTL